MPPDITPQARHPAGVVPTGYYLPRDPVWIYHAGAWCPGVIQSASEEAATVTFRLPDAPGTGQDTVSAPYVLARFDPDPLLDPEPVTTAPRQRAIVPSNYPFWRHSAHENRIS